MEPGQLEDAADGGVRLVAEHDAEGQVALARAPQPSDEHAEDRRVDERRLVQVDDDRVGLGELVQASTQLGSGGEVVLSREGDDRPAAVDRRRFDAPGARQRSAPRSGVWCGLGRMSHETYLPVDVTSNTHAEINRSSVQHAGRRNGRRPAAC